MIMRFVSDGMCHNDAVALPGKNSYKLGPGSPGSFAEFYLQLLPPLQYSEPLHKTPCITVFPERRPNYSSICLRPIYSSKVRSNTDKFQCKHVSWRLSLLEQSPVHTSSSKECLAWQNMLHVLAA